jgi:hypothetical protein
MDTIALAYKEGDLIYGLEEYRKIAVKIIKKNFPTVNMTIDSYNNFIRQFGLIPEYSKNGYIKYDQETENLVSNNDMTKNYSKEYFNFLKTKQIKIPTKNISKRPFFENDSDSDDDFDPTKRVNNITRKCCQYGFWFAKSNNKRIHFILDGMSDGDFRISGDEGPSITSSEFRYVCRHWDKLKNTVSFYKNNKLLVWVNNPWDLFPIAAINYKKSLYRSDNQEYSSMSEGESEFF